MKDVPRSEWMKFGVPQRENMDARHFITVDAHIFWQGKAIGNLEYSSIIVNMKGFLREGKGPLKSILNLSIGLVDFINVPSSGV